MPERPTFEPVFADLRGASGAVGGRGVGRPATALPEHEWSTDGQVALAHEIATMVGFDLGAGVIARSEHPFTSTVHRGDVRFTTRLDPTSPIGNIGAVMHEAGHALYEQGFPADADRTPVHDAPSLGAHESQSRFWENHVGHRGVLAGSSRRCVSLPGGDGRHRSRAASTVPQTW